MKQAFTLIEVLIVMAIIIIMAAMLTGSLNPSALTNKGTDATRKKDLARIKVALEEYMNDRGCYPTDPLLAELEDPNNCGSDVFSPWLPTWPCDPSGRPYYVVVEEAGVCEESGGCIEPTWATCPSWFKVLVELQNRNDDDIPAGWGVDSILPLGSSLTSDDVNYGVSSTNINWFDRVEVSSLCSATECYNWGGGSCNSNNQTGQACTENCYTHDDCIPACAVSSCVGIY